MTAEPPLTPTLAEKVAYLSRPESYAEGTVAVEMIETHMSFVFLANGYVYKLKKPVRYPFLDFSTLDARHFNCTEEVRLNRRLARNIYLGVVPLSLSPDGLKLDNTGHVVEWLVKMRRLPRHLMLDRALQERRVRDNDIARLTRVLAGFYREAEPARFTPSAYRERLRRAIDDNHHVLSNDGYDLPGDLLGTLREQQIAFLEQNAAAFARRVHDNIIVEGHGDLRPEHVCLAAEPVVIDCLEFNRDLRLVDPADELGYLAMECEFIGAPDVRSTLFAMYRMFTGDAVENSLIDFYQASRALLRAKLAVWHIEDHTSDGERAKWLGRARDYLRLAQHYCSRLEAPAMC